MNVEPFIIRQLVVATQAELPVVAEKHGLTVPIAQVIKEHWTRRFLGACVKCGKRFKGDRCPSCGTSKGSSMELLQKLDPRSRLFRRECAKCQGEFFHYVGYVMKVTNLHGGFFPASICPTCRREKAEGKKMLVRLPKPLNMPVRTCPRTGELLQRPFVALMQVKPLKQAPRSEKRASVSV